MSALMMGQTGCEMTGLERTLIEIAAQSGVYIEAFDPEFSPVGADGAVTATLRFRTIDTRAIAATKGEAPDHAHH
jgi:hypothetical protein